MVRLKLAIARHMPVLVYNGKVGFHLSLPHWPPRHLSLPQWPPRHLSQPHWPWCATCRCSSTTGRWGLIDVARHMLLVLATS